MTDDRDHRDDPPGSADGPDSGPGRGDGPGGCGRAEYVWPRERTAPQYVGGSAETEAADETGDGGAGETRRRRARPDVQAKSRRRRRRNTVLALIGLAVIVGVAVIGGKALIGSIFDSPQDYAGSGEQGVVVRVSPGDTTTDIAHTLAGDDVVKSVQAFLDAASGNAAMGMIHPGYYQVKTKMSAQSAVGRMTAEDARVGAVVVPHGRQLTDVTTVGGDVTPGILTLISRASCMKDSGTRTCISVDDLSDALSASDPAELGVPDWALSHVQAVDDPVRRYEGLIKAGSWNFDPTEGPEGALRSLLTESAASYRAKGVTTADDQTGLGPYDTLVAASLLEHEAPPGDFPKVARVILNRLDEGQKLQFDSTVNYTLDRQEVATTDEDRAERTQWNTYTIEGLPATPIASPGDKALQAAEYPADGDWLYFVTVSKDGTTVFSDDFDRHLANIDEAQQAGVLDSGR